MDAEFLKYIKDVTDKYTNPSNTDEIMEELTNCKTLGEVKALTERVFPEWFVTTMPRFCEDYPHFQKNWETVCQKIGVKPAQVMIVEEVEQGDQYSLIQHFAECFTRAGFVVRKKMEFIPCETCNAAVPSQIVYSQLKDKGITIPQEWSETCSSCN
tara:strand:+ start:138 stop:605 length:468 start_codon:yes stop_codon:yes gene_type:complete